MLNSMTGFARETADTAFGTMTCELRAVNHRFLDVQFRLPEELRSKEHDLRGLLGGTLSRGKIECSLYLKRGAGDAAELALNGDLVRRIAARAAEIAGHLPESSPINPLDVLRWPGVVVEPDVDTEPMYREAAGVIGRALALLADMRASEGDRIHALIDARLDDVLVIAQGVRKRLPEVLAAVRQRQRERIDRLEVDADPARLETELALIAQKLDVDEEIDRLESHVSEVRAAMQADEPVGRRLDFLMQELNREANTLGSKSADTETTKAAVDLKVLIEQMREQVQNVE